MTAPELDAAKRLGVLPQYVNSHDVPEEALAAPKDYVLINDGRDVHGDAMVVWLAKVDGRRAEVVRMVARLPRRGPSRPMLFTNAEAAGVQRHIVSRQGLSNRILRLAHAPSDATEDLTGAELVLDVLGER